MMKSKLTKIIIASVLLLFWFLLIDINETILLLKKIDLVYLLWPIAIMTVNLVLGSYIFKIIIGSAFPVRLGYLIRLTLLGSAASLFAPANAGGLLRAYLIKLKYKKSFSKIFGFILLEFVMDLLIVFMVGAIGVLYFARYVTGVGTLVGIIVIIIVVGLVILLKPNIIKTIAQKIMPSSVYSVLLIYFGALWRGFVSVSKKPQILFRVGGMLLVHHILFGISLYFILLSIGVVRPILDVIFANSLLGSISSIPSLPGKIGHFELAGLLALTKPLGISASQAAAVTFLHRLIGITYIILMTVIILVFNKDDLKLIKSISLDVSKLKNELKK